MFKFTRFSFFPYFVQIDKQVLVSNEAILLRFQLAYTGLYSIIRQQQQKTTNRTVFIIVQAKIKFYNLIKS